ncbi:hypothetical protein AIOL_002828 [Candidatus Rhodobacter oscarellae]|uniref:Uncharacterized protein n=1 Tax=Candidatus Rhodobacter oscarellae TaxID=1675527 RepID=A0A0J9E4Y2_9RHOB|nr:tetratricopeptide repeat protein [Candidatus Rhodobacter lobularis]KMW57860.1 hypothetical protein AIOL_002828 [Candidatus Rhodobacter lobularis]
MSETDSFIEEVSEEVRRERLFGYMRRYGWIAILAVVVLVAGAAYNEYRKAQDRAAAQARGDAILAALEAEAGAARLDILQGVEDADAAAPIVSMLAASEALAADDPAAAAAALEAIINDASHAQLYRDLATLKHAILTAGSTEPDARISALANLTRPGGAFRTLAEEQIAIAEVQKGDSAAAITRLQALVSDIEATEGLRLRARQLIVALGGTLEPS